MRNKVLRITETALMLAVLIALQAVTRGFGQLVTGSCVNAVLAVTVLLTGLSSGLTVGVISPVMAFLLGIAPNIVTVVPIMLGNCLYVLVLWLLAGKKDRPLWVRWIAVPASAGVKFAVLYGLVVKLVCGVASGVLLGQKIGQTVVLAPPMLEKLPAMFTWPQLITALIGGAVALPAAAAMRRVLKRQEL